MKRYKIVNVYMSEVRADVLNRFPKGYTIYIRVGTYTLVKICNILLDKSTNGPAHRFYLLYFYRLYL